jgi:metallo-beta-lactamase family protein
MTSIEIILHGAAGGVTGSCHEVRTPRSRILVDCGQFQGGPSSVARNRRPLPIDPADLDAVLITHAHVDHIGRLPMLGVDRLGGPILATDATIDLAGIILRDAAHLQVQHARRLARGRRRRGRSPDAGHDRGPIPPPLFTPEDVDPVMRRFRDVPYGRPIQVTEDITATWQDAGHILGSASIRLDITVGPSGGAAASTRTIVFSGDVGQHDTPLLRDPQPFDHADLVLLESTYGDRDHRPRAETRAELQGLLNDAITHGEKVLVPAFALGRTQTLLYHIRGLLAEHALTPVPVYLDSPMAIDATTIYRRHAECFDEDARAILARGKGPMSFPGLRMLRETSESRALNDSWEPAVIIAGSGMCNGGRIVHHLKHNLWRRNVSVLIVGYQAEGTLGRRLVAGERQVRVLGEPIAVRAAIHTVGGLSAHAGRQELIEWAEAVRTGGRRFILNHGEPPASAALAAALVERGLDARPAVDGETITLD